jgi:hypothetical protein
MVIIIAPVSAPRMIRDDLIPRRILNPGIIVSPEEVQVWPIDLVGSREAEGFDSIPNRFGPVVHVDLE